MRGSSCQLVLLTLVLTLTIWAHTLITAGLCAAIATIADSATTARTTPTPHNDKMVGGGVDSIGGGWWRRRMAASDSSNVYYITVFYPTLLQPITRIHQKPYPSVWVRISWGQGATHYPHPSKSVPQSVGMDKLGLGCG
jgi:hypothetical protein